MAPKKVLWPSMGRVRHIAVALALGMVVLLTFSNTLRNTGFALDNKFIILDDPRLRKDTPENRGLIFHQDYWWPKAVSGLYRPLTTLSYMFNYSILGNANDSTDYHWVNFLAHWLDAVLVYFLALVLMETFWPAVFIAALFATHPIVTESVSNIVGRADLFAAAAIIGGFLCYAKSTTVEGWRKVPWLVALMLITTVGEFCKESAVAVLGLMALYDFLYRLQRKRPNWLANLVANFREFAIKGYVALAPPFVFLWIVRSRIFEKLRPPELPFVDNPMIGWSFWTARMTAIKVIGKYFWLLLWPRHLSCDYSFNQIPKVTWQFFGRWEDFKALVALICVVAVIVVAVRNFRRNKPLSFFILLFFGTFLPTSNLVFIIGSIMAERFMYLPSIGFAGCAVIATYAVCRWIVPRLSPGNPSQRANPQLVAGVVLVLIVTACGMRSYRRNSAWENDVELWTRAVQVCPDSFKTHKSLAYALYERDQDRNPPAFPDIGRIIEEGQKARAIIEEIPANKPLYRASIVYLHLGAYYRIQGDLLAPTDPKSARSWYEKSIATLKEAVVSDHAFNEDNRNKELARGRAPNQIPDIGNQEIYSNLALTYTRLGQFQDALNAYSMARHLTPTSTDLYLNIASLYLSTNHPEEAAVTLVQALLIDGNRKDALSALAEIYGKIDREGCAVVKNGNELRLNADCAIVHNHLCSAASGLVQIFVQAKQFDLARQMQHAALQNYHCPAGLFQNLIPNQTTTSPTL
ncbi:MAG TPA: DUF1736 domain-containing protein [Verrucomicrobiae bacterium]|nr:DUF1736 domain-containing protein [Verrucomicrobiae bacterium]